VRPVEGALAADSLIQAPRRTSASVAALMLSLALVVAFAGMARASYLSITDWMDTTLNPDLFVAPTQDIVVRTLRFPPDMEAELRGTPGIARVQAVRNARVVFRETPVMIVATDIASIAETVRVDPIAGDTATMYARTAAGSGLMVSDNFAELQRLSVGDVLEIPAPHGVVKLPIAGIVLDYSDQQGTILMDRSVFVRYWRDDSVNLFRVYLSPGSEVADVKQRILERYQGERQVFVLTNGELRAYIIGITDQWFAGRDSRHRQHADRVNHRSPPRAGCPARGRRDGGADPADDLDGGDQHRCPRPDSRVRVRGAEPVLHPPDRPSRHRRHAARLLDPAVDARDAGADDPRRGVRRRDLARRIRGSRLSRGGARI
jgi:hypothetical protein